MSALGDGVFVLPDRRRAAGAAGFCLCEERVPCGTVGSGRAFGERRSAG